MKRPIFNVLDILFNEDFDLSEAISLRRTYLCKIFILFEEMFLLPLLSRRFPNATVLFSQMFADTPIDTTHLISLEFKLLVSLWSHAYLQPLYLNIFGYIL